MNEFIVIDSTEKTFLLIGFLIAIPDMIYILFIYFYNKELIFDVGDRVAHRPTSNTLLRIVAYCRACLQDAADLYP